MENWAENIEQAHETVRTLAAVGISMQEVTDSLLADGVQKFCELFDKLLAAVEMITCPFGGRALAMAKPSRRRTGDEREFVFELEVHDRIILPSSRRPRRAIGP
jgi:hypothetical protein